MQHRAETALQRVSQHDNPELFIGLVGAIGINTEMVSCAIQEALDPFDFEVEKVSLIDNLDHVDGFQNYFNEKDDTFARYKGKMNAGDAYRELMEDSAALAALAIADLHYHRVATAVGKENGDGSKLDKYGAAVWPRRTFIFKSLKTPAEVALFRAVYGDSFILVGLFADRTYRQKQLAEKIRSDRGGRQSREFESMATELLNRDELDTNAQWGQRLSQTFHLADVFLAAESPEILSKDASRFFRLLMGNPFITPSIDEQSMFLAKAAGLRSADLSRQVGAVITDDRGMVIAMGCNEVPRAGGGAYWENDEPDLRDFRTNRSTSLEYRRTVLIDLLDSLREDGWLKETSEKDYIDSRNKILDKRVNPNVVKSQLMDVIEYGRAVHAEMHAITSAAMKGRAIENSTLYSTTFPCHQCAPHIVSSGIRRVVFIEPYPKSLAFDLYGDSIAASQEEEKSKVKFSPFLGVSPRIYQTFFKYRPRKTDAGEPKHWSPKKDGRPVMGRHPALYLLREREMLQYMSEEEE